MKPYYKVLMTKEQAEALKKEKPKLRIFYDPTTGIAYYIKVMKHLLKV